MGGPKKGENDQQRCREYCKGRLHLFQSQKLSAVALGSVQKPFTDYWIDIIAELRGMHVVLYTPTSYKRGGHFERDDFVAVLMLHQYRIDVVKRGVTRIYFTPDCRSCGVLAYVQPIGDEIDQWRLALGKVKNCIMVKPSDLRIYSRIGVGGYGKVYVARYRKGGMFSDITSEYSDSFSEGIGREINEGDAFALKVIPKSTILNSCTSFRLLSAERLILERARNSPYLLGLSFAFQTRKHVFLGTPLCAGGDLAAYLSRVTPPKVRFRRWHRKCCEPFFERPRLREDEVSRIGAQMIVALQTLHEWNVVYRDLKPENILLDEKGNCVLGDFGLSRFMTPGECGEFTVCGTETCMSPETRLGKGSFEADVWSLGATLYKLLTGRAPFPRGGPNESDPIPEFPCFVKRSTRGMLRDMLALNPDDRVSLTRLREHKFFKRVLWKDVEEGNMIALPMVQRLVKQQRRFGGAKMAMTTAMWRSLNGVSVNEDGCWDGREPGARDAHIIPGLEYGSHIGRFRSLPVFGEQHWIRGSGGTLPDEVRLFLYS